QSKKIEFLPQEVPTPKSGPKTTPEIPELWKTNATPLPVEPKLKPQMEKPPVGKGGSRGPSPIQTILNEVVAEKTGYPPEMLDLDMELDSDLGIDSIKRVEIFSALQERLPQAPAVKSEHLGTLRTLRQVVDFLSVTTSAEIVKDQELEPLVAHAIGTQSVADNNGQSELTNGYRSHEPAPPGAYASGSERRLRRYVLTAQPLSAEAIGTLLPLLNG